MKRFLGLLVIGFLLFMALAITDEWSYFSSAWFGAGISAPQHQPVSGPEIGFSLTDFNRRVAQRYADPAPLAFRESTGAGPETAGELWADLMYLKHRGWRQTSTLDKLEVDTTRELSAGKIEVWTREWWSHTLSKGGEDEERSVSRVRCLYRLQRAGENWEIVGWDALPPGDFEGSPQAAGALR